MNRFSSADQVKIAFKVKNKYIFFSRPKSILLLDRVMFFLKAVVCTSSVRENNLHLKAHLGSF